MLDHYLRHHILQGNLLWGEPHGKPDHHAGDDEHLHLPPTSDTKMIDIWLIFCLLVPFAFTLLQTANKCYREETTEAKRWEAWSTEPIQGGLLVCVYPIPILSLNCNSYKTNIAGERESGKAWFGKHEITIVTLEALQLAGLVFISCNHWFMLWFLIMFRARLRSPSVPVGQSSLYCPCPSVLLWTSVNRNNWFGCIECFDVVCCIVCFIIKHRKY